MFILLKKICKASLLSFPLLPYVDHDNEASKRFCQRICFDFIFLKTIIFWGVFAFYSLVFCCLLIMGCFKANKINITDVKTKTTEKSNEDSIKIMNLMKGNLRKVSVYPE